MVKNTCIIYAPIDSYSGYSSDARDKVRAFIELKKEVWDIKIIVCDWGTTPRGFLTDNEEEWGWMKDYITRDPIKTQPDYMIWITIPTEAAVVGRYNILITAGIETTLCDGSWIEGLNKMDMNIVPSNHSKNVFQNLIFEKQDQNNNSLGQLKLEKPVHVVFEGSNTDIFYPIQNANKDIFDLENIKENFCFLFNSVWIGNSLMNDRKHLGLLIKLFYETFKNISNPPALILKTSMGTSSYMSKDEILKRIKIIRKTIEYKTLPNIYILNGNITDEDMNNLYNHPKVKAMVNLTHGEGFGRSLLEFSLVNKPIITTNWSGQTDFLDSSLTTLLPGKLQPVHSSAVNQWILKDSKWFEVDQKTASYAMNDMFINYKKYQQKAIKQGYKNRNTFSYEKMKELMDKLLKDIPSFAAYQPIVLPKLKKIE